MLPKMNLTYLFPLSRNKACQVIRKCLRARSRSQKWHIFLFSTEFFYNLCGNSQKLSNTKTQILFLIIMEHPWFMLFGLLATSKGFDSTFPYRQILEQNSNTTYIFARLISGSLFRKTRWVKVPNRDSRVYRFSRVNVDYGTKIQRFLSWGNLKSGISCNLATKQ